MENATKYKPKASDAIERVIDMQKGRVMPQAVDLERAVLGGIIIDKNGVDDVVLLLKTPDIFYNDAHRLIFKAIQALHEKSMDIDLLTVPAQLRSSGDIEAAGGDYYIIELTQAISSSAHIETHCRILQQKWVARQMIRDAAELQARAFDETVDVFDLLNEASVKLDGIIEKTQTGRADMLLGKALDVIQERVELLSSKKETNAVSGALTGFKKLDLITGGWQKSDLIYIAARPGMGKTSFVMKTLLDNVKAGNAVGFISLEMSTQQLVTRMVACNSHFHLNQLFRTGFDKSKYFEQYLELKNTMKDYPAYFDDKSMDLTEVVAKGRLWHRKYGIKLLIIDYLQLMHYGGLKKGGNREQEISSISGALKRLAKELDIPVIALSQLSRAVETRGSSKRPMLSDLRESGSIEQDADVVGFIYRPGYYNIEVDEDMEAMGANAEFILAKHRNGGLDRKGLFFDENKTKFMDPDDIADTERYDAAMHADAGAGGNDNWDEIAKERAASYKPTANEAFSNENNNSDKPPF